MQPAVFLWKGIEKLPGSELSQANDRIIIQVNMMIEELIK
jgi:hypothetical protein